MKKSEALNILGLADGATDDEVKKAHRKLVIAHHPDKFPLDSPERAQAEEMAKQINEARDVLLNRSWTPEYDPRRDPRPYANPYAHPTYSPTGSAPGSAPGQGSAQDPFAGWPFGQGQTTYVWTSWGDGATGAGQASDSFDPFDPFAPFRAQTRPSKTPQQVLEEAKSELRREALYVGGKAAVLGLLTLVGSLAAGLFFYVVASIILGLWKRFGACLIGFAIPLLVIATPFVFIIAPREGAVTIGLAVFFFAALAFDIVNVRDSWRVYRRARQATKQAAASEH